MNNILLSILIGVAIFSFVVGVVSLFLAWKDARDKKIPLYPMLTLGIVFLFPGIIALILHQEYTIFLSLGIIFSLSGAVARYVSKWASYPKDRSIIFFSSLIGFTIGGVGGAAISMFVNLPDLPLIVLLGTFGLLAGMLFGQFSRRYSQV